MDDKTYWLRVLMIGLITVLSFLLIISTVRCSQESYALSDCRLYINKVIDFRKVSKENFCAADRENCYKAETKLVDDVIKECNK